MKESVYQLITGRIINLLQQNIVPWRQPWKSCREAPRNLASKRRYQGINAFLLHAMPYESPYWLTFYQARQFGGMIREREKATPVVFWKRIIVENAKTGDKETKLVVRHWSVFNVAQCEGLGRQLPKPEITVASTEPIAAASTIVENMPNRPPIKHGFAKAFYASEDDYVAMPFPTAFENQEQYFSALFHELGHATGHEKRLDRDTLRGARGNDPSDYPKEELCAEMTSAFLCGECGITERTIENSAAYIKDWLQHLKNNPKLVIHAAAQAQKAADYILNRKAEDEQAEVPVEQKEAV